MRVGRLGARLLNNAPLQALGFSRPQRRPVMAASNAAPGQVTRFAVVGDVHGDWSARDEVALQFLAVDFSIFVGDFGNEDVELVSQIASCPGPKAVMLGNHDAWSCLAPRNREVQWPAKQPEGKHESSSTEQWSSSRPAMPSRKIKDPASRVREQMGLLGDDNLAWNCLGMDGTGVSVVGARPFSKGGKDWKRVNQFYHQLFDVNSFEESSRRITAAVKEANPSDSIVLVAHNGPSGLGTCAHDICGVDFDRSEGDHGDVDLRMALDELQRDGRAIAVVVFGHMHQRLRFGGQRRMVHADADEGTVYINAAVVPRVLGRVNESVHHFCVVTLKGGTVEGVEFVWVQVDEAGKRCSVSTHRELLNRGDDGVNAVFDTHTDRWESSRPRKAACQKG